MFMECPAGCSWNGWPDDVECADYARAVLDEIERPTRRRAQIGVAY